MDEAEPPTVVNFAKPILTPDGNVFATLDARFMYVSDWPMWTDAERAAIQGAAEAFQAEWEPGDAFGEWHYLVLGGRLTEIAASLHDLPKPYHFDKPIVVLMDGDCFSATSIFLEALGMRTDVTLVGTAAPAGSGRTREHEITDDRNFDIRLSTTMVSFRPDGRLFDGSVIEPDIESWPTLSDLAGETDTQRDAAIRAIAAERDGVE